MRNQETEYPLHVRILLAAICRGTTTPAPLFMKLYVLCLHGLAV